MVGSDASQELELIDTIIRNLKEGKALLEQLKDPLIQQELEKHKAINYFIRNHLKVGLPTKPEVKLQSAAVKTPKNGR